MQWANNLGIKLVIYLQNYTDTITLSSREELFFLLV